MSHPVRILSISDDDGLRYSRELLLAKDGYETESMTSNTALSISRVKSANPFDIALICRSVDPERALAICSTLRRYNPGIQILCISPLENRMEAYGGDLEILSGPEPVLEAIRQVSSGRTAHRESCQVSHP